MKYGLLMPIFVRRWLLSELHHMCLHFEEQGGFRADPAAFRRVVPEALSAEDWFRFHGRCVCVCVCVCGRARARVCVCVSVSVSLSVSVFVFVFARARARLRTSLARSGAARP